MDFRVGPWLIRPGLNRIVNGPRSLHVTPKSMEVLVCLAKREGSVVSKDELFQEVWAGTYVTDDALTKCIGELRRAFDGTRREPSIIETIPKRGYRVAVPVIWDTGDTMASGEPGAAVTTAPEAGGGPGDSLAPLNAAAPAAKPSFWKRHRVLAVGGVLLLTLAIAVAAGGARLRALLGIRGGPPAIQSIAVLPLTDLSGNPEQEWFAEGMTEELITELAQIEAWKVISRTSVMRYKGTKKSLPEIARELRVDAVVEGTVLRSGSRVRITAQLIHAATDTHLWSGSFEREIDDVFGLQRSIARGIASELKIKLNLEEQVRASRKRRIVPEAYEEYLKGCYFLDRNQYANAESHFEQATQKDPEFALAHALLWEADAWQTFVQDAPPSAKARRALDTSSGAGRHPG